MSIMEILGLVLMAVILIIGLLGITFYLLILWAFWHQDS